MNPLHAVVAMPVMQRIAVKVVVVLAEWLVDKTENQFDNKLLASIKDAAGLK
tara:strand:+ start:143 stop:298 length:156 start_codon:yes stop_codon:yes gene_type:complete